MEIRFATIFPNMADIETGLHEFFKLAPGFTFYAQFIYACV